MGLVGHGVCPKPEIIEWVEEEIGNDVFGQLLLMISSIKFAAYADLGKLLQEKIKRHYLSMNGVLW